jgi:hypothetical protein
VVKNSNIQGMTKSGACRDVRLSISEVEVADYVAGNKSYSTASTPLKKNHTYSSQHLHCRNYNEDFDICIFAFNWLLLAIGGSDSPAAEAAVTDPPIPKPALTPTPAQTGFQPYPGWIDIYDSPCSDYEGNTPQQVGGLTGKLLQSIKPNASYTMVHSYVVILLPQRTKLVVIPSHLMGLPLHHHGDFSS